MSKPTRDELAEELQFLRWKRVGYLKVGTTSKQQKKEARRIKFIEAKLAQMRLP